MYSYTFETSQPLSKAQLAHLNEVLSDITYPTKDPEHLLDVPEWTTDVTGLVWEDQPTVTYAHMNDPEQTCRFRAFKSDPLPPWAVDVQDEVN